MEADTNVGWQMKYYYRLRNRLQMPRWFMPTACLCTYPPPQPQSQTKLAHWNRRLGDGLKHTSYGSFSVLKCLNAYMMALWHSRIEFPRVVLGSWWSSFPDHRFAKAMPRHYHDFLNASELHSWSVLTLSMYARPSWSVLHVECTPWPPGGSFGSNFRETNAALIL